MVRFRDDTPEFQDRARKAVAGWRARHRQGTADEMAADLAGQFPGYEAALRSFLFITDRDAGADADARQVTEAPARGCGTVA